MSSAADSSAIVWRCPVCRAAVENGPLCRRCRADLGLLFALERQRARELQAAREALRQAHWAAAFEGAERVRRLRPGVDACATQALACLLQYDFAGAWRWYLQARRPASVALTARPAENS